MDGKSYLWQIKKIETQIRNKAFEEKRLKELGLSTTRVLEDKEKLQNERAEIIKTIEQLPEAEYDVLYKVYVKYETLQAVAVDRGICRRQVDSIHGRALKLLESIINANK